MTTASRSVFALGMAGAYAWAMAGCVSALGLDEEKKDAVDRFCSCEHARLLYGDTNPKAACVADLTSDLESATEPTRAAWMKNYEQNCASCPVGDSSIWLSCVKLKPTCARTGDLCKADFDSCCSPGVCSAEGKCG